MLKIIIVFVLLIFGLSIGIWKIQPNLIFFPSHNEEAYKTLEQNEHCEKIMIKGTETTLCGWIHYNRKISNQPLIIMFGGNAQNSSETFALYEMEGRMKNYFTDYNIMMMDYPGYGKSIGELSDETIYDAALKAYDYACSLKYVDKNNIVVIGYSLGTSPATYLASERDVNGLVLISPFDNATNIYNNTLPIFHGPAQKLIRYQFNTDEYAKNADVKPIIFASEDDEVVPYELSYNLMQSFNEMDLFMTLHGTSHNDMMKNEEVWKNIQDYLGGCIEEAEKEQNEKTENVTGTSTENNE